MTMSSAEDFVHRLENDKEFRAELVRRIDIGDKGQFMVEAGFDFTCDELATARGGEADSKLLGRRPGASCIPFNCGRSDTSGDYLNK